MPADKLLPLSELAPIIAAEKKKGKRIALANGGFDLFHVGHLRYLQGAKEVADLLVVAVNSDRSLRGLKGESRALVDQAGRAKIVASLSCVDYVTLFDEPRVDAVLLALKPHVHCKGSDYSVQSVPERDIVIGYGGEIAIVGGPKVRSSSEIIALIKRSYG